MSEQNRIITKPFFAIDVYNDGDQFLFVYLDDGNDPAVYEGLYYGSGDYPDWIHKVSNTLSSYINDLVDRVQEGGSAF